MNEAREYFAQLDEGNERIDALKAIERVQKRLSAIDVIAKSKHYKRQMDPRESAEWMEVEDRVEQSQRDLKMLWRKVHALKESSG